MRQKRVIYENGSRYILTEDSEVILERKQRRGYAKGYEDGTAMRVWKPPTSDSSPLPKINYSKLGKLYDAQSYAKGFADGYYNRA